MKRLHWWVVMSGDRLGLLLVCDTPWPSYRTADVCVRDIQSKEEYKHTFWIVQAATKENAIKRVSDGEPAVRLR